MKTLRAFLLTFLFVATVRSQDRVPLFPATQAEVNAGIINTKGVTPLTLKNWPGGGGGGIASNAIAMFNGKGTNTYLTNAAFVGALSTNTTLYGTTVIPSLTGILRSIAGSQFLGAVPNAAGVLTDDGTEAYAFSTTPFISGANFTAGTINSNALDAPTKAQLALAGGVSTMTALNTVWVSTNGNDATALAFFNANGRRGSDAFPFVTLSNAIQAVTNINDTVKFNIASGRFDSFPLTLLENDLVHYCGSNRMIFQGSGSGDYDSTNDTRNILGGTVIEGTMQFNRPYIELRDLAVDVGKEVCDRKYSGAFKDGIVFAAFTNGWDWSTNTLNKGCVIKNVRVLCYTNTSLCHSIAFENTVDGTLEDITTRYGVHGLAIKGWNIKGDRLTMSGHFQDCVIIKITSFELPGKRANAIAAASNYGCGMITLNNLNMSSLNAGSDTGGIYFDLTAGVSYICDVNISGVNCFALSNDVYFNNAGSGGELQAAQIWLSDFSAPTITKAGHPMLSVYVNGVSQ